ncbi:MAG: 5-(carboxyamino)imidazole ribonucleotide mutase [Syntrophorhabdaceae bacterium]|nr:5-(carboxyamino)imidazole ribonucleotide mutase [Syntrophorhabdaceae bacterium]MDD4195387.1 5-(carboxyamino)imidazole ribonucleotide mutase [Syntrophorhabdaceae bacterium]HOC45987.1 5-(carboxyamino)imidazole ribonucleotide mutase [Syntrophorhabdaceae bacterium]
MQKPKILILLGSDSDINIIEDGLKFLTKLQIPFMVDISSAHRNPEKTVTYAKNARKQGIEVIIAVAGMAAHLPGVIASHTTLPVIGVPVSSGMLKGQDALYSIVQMPLGVPVASVGIDAGKNAAILASQILSIKYEDIAQSLIRLKKDLKRENEQKSLNIRKKLGN